jgi:hypothetical protein
MENIICIENAQIKTKIKNFIKTCDSLLSMQKELDRTLQAVNAFKVLLRFLKNDSTLIEVYNRFDASGALRLHIHLLKKSPITTTLSRLLARIRSLNLQKH